VSLPWYRWFPGDFAGNVRVRMMSWQARAAYRELLDASWGLGAIADPPALLRALGLPGELWEEVRPCWRQTPEGWANGRLEDERGQGKARHQQAAKAGAASAQVRRRGKRELSSGSTRVEREMSSGSTHVEPELSSGSTQAALGAEVELNSRDTNQNQNQNQNQNHNTTVHQQQLSACEAPSGAAAEGVGDEGFPQEALR
jgi:uncharacterized protein YdaU (DUF1376 family)